MNYWTFKHKPGIKSNENDAKEFVEKAIILNSAIMQYEYGSEDKGKVTQNWNDALKIKVGDCIFLRGDAQIYAVGEVIAPRKEEDIILNANEIIQRKSHGDYFSEDFSGCIHFEDSEAFYEDLTDATDWGQRIDVISWKYYFSQGIYAKDQTNYIEGSNEFGVIKRLKDSAGLSFYNQLKNRFMGKEMELLGSNKNLILTGAPGTGKTYLAKQMALKFMFGKNDEKLLSEVENMQFGKQFCFVQFHPSYDYTDFVEGLRPEKKDDKNEIGFVLKDGTFMEFCKNAKKAIVEDSDKSDDEKRKFVFVIDEINRGEISKIFGELFFSIDPGYRGPDGKVKTQYANLRERNDQYFYVPENVYIIGTMNDIDRSVESFDFAMRRRFVWKEITSEESAQNMSLSDDCKKRMFALNHAISKTEGLNSSYHLGAAYFLKLELYKDEPYKCLWNNHLKGLLSEYLRGTPKVEDKLKALEAAYNDEK